MTKYKGRDAVIQLSDNATVPAYHTIGGLRTNKMTINNNPVDVSDDSSGWRQLIADAGVQSMDVSGDGCFADDVNLSLVQGAAVARTALTMQIAFGNGNKFLGSFAIASFERSGSHDGAETYTISLQSTGAITGP
jgi:TP901-1 family phage major tail protein